MEVCAVARWANRMQPARGDPLLSASAPFLQWGWGAETQEGPASPGGFKFSAQSTSLCASSDEPLAIYQDSLSKSKDRLWGRGCPGVKSGHATRQLWDLGRSPSGSMKRMNPPKITQRGEGRGRLYCELHPQLSTELSGKDTTHLQALPYVTPRYWEITPNVQPS